MDTSAAGTNVNRILMTQGGGKFVETTFEIPKLGADEILVQSVMTGVCRSDIDMMCGMFGPLPLHMQGHEGLGKVLSLGSAVKDVEVGNLVATRGEPAYADRYVVKHREYVIVPEAHPRYILEPVACGINLVHQSIGEYIKRSGPGRRMLILGSGFLAWVAYHTVLLNKLEFEITVLGNSNKNLWGDILVQSHSGKFDVVLDLSSRLDVFEQDIMQTEGLVIFGSQKQVKTDFANLLWKACTMVFPSPRTDKFFLAMNDAAYWVKNGQMQVDSFWSKAYNRNTEWQQAFLDGRSRPPNYSRGFIYW